MRTGRIGLVLIILGLQAGCGGGSSSATPTAAPSSLTYSTNPAVYTKGAAIATNTPTSSGGAVVSYSVLPALPAGLIFDTSTGVISGTPTAVIALATYTVTAMNSGGSTRASLSITVKDVAPSNLTYSTNPAVYSKGAGIASNTPTSSSGAVVAYSVLPALPAGLIFDTSTGVISGIPTAVTPQATYTVTATNSGGFTTGDLVITVNDVAPSSLAYSTNPAVYTKNADIASNMPTSSGGAVVSYSVLPALPMGLSLDPSTGVVSGTPTAVTAQAMYTVTATNSGGFTTGDLVITVNDVAPSSLAYSTNPAVYTKNAAIASNMPTSSGGAVVSYSVLPALPVGLSLDTSTGVISGTPTALAAQATYTLTATNSGGFTTGDLVITVKDIAPSNLAYSTNPAAYTRGVAIAANTPTGSGGAVVSYSVLPALPAGLSLDFGTGVISGTPTAVTAQATYTVTATNSGGFTTGDLVITVKDVAPSNLAYSTSPAVYTKGTGIAANTPTSSGGPVVSYSVSPALPAGLGLNTSTGVISGIPAAVTAQAAYTVTATNSGGFTTGDLVITVNDVVPSNLTYSTNPAVYTKGAAIVANTPTSSGGAVVSYSVLPALPAGLGLDSGTGVISGVPTAVTPQATYAVTATNSGGNTPASVSITINNPPPTRFAYVANREDNTVSIYTVDAATGRLRANGYVAAGTVPVSVTVDPAGKFVYVANEGSGNVSAYTINANTGALSSIGSPVAAGTWPLSVTVDPSGKFAYVANYYSNDVSAYSINASTGALTSIGSPVAAGVGPASVTVDPSDKFAYVANWASNDVSAYTINASTGALTSVGSPVAAGSYPASVTVDPSGRFAYVANLLSSSVSAYTINASTGALTSVGSPVAAGSYPASVTVDPSGKFAYVANSRSDNVSAYSINASTGVLTSLGSPVAAGIYPYSVTVDPSGTFAYVANYTSNDVSAYSINASTGSLTPLGTICARFGARSIAVAQGATPVTYVPKFAYVANNGSNDVSVYTVNTSTGALTSVGSPVAAGTRPTSVTVDPSGKFAYVANQGSSNVSAYTIDASTGALTSVGSPVATAAVPESVTVDPSGRFAYVANANTNYVSAYTINSSTGALTSVGPPVAAGSLPYSVAVDPSGRFAYVANFFSSTVSAYTINASNGALTSVGSVAAGTYPRSVTVHPSGKFAYVANFSSSNISAYTINANTGALTSVGSPVAAGMYPYSVTVDPSGKFAYAANAGSNDVSAYTINASTGALTSVGSPVAAGLWPWSVTVDPSGKFAYVANYSSSDVSAYTINTSTGALTSVGSPVAAGSAPVSVTVAGSIQ